MKYKALILNVLCNVFIASQMPLSLPNSGIKTIDKTNTKLSEIYFFQLRHQADFGCFYVVFI